MQEDEIDPKNDRVVKEILPPPLFNIEHKKLFPSDSKPDWKLLKKHLTQEGRLDKSDVLQLIGLFRNIIKAEPNILKIEDPVTVVGDIHGQFYDLIQILDLGGNIEKTKYIFLGDYVDRGAFSTECVFLLMAIKINFKHTVVMLRGNHECRQLTSFFNFKQECEVKYDIEVYNRLMEAFDCLPFGCIINDKFLCVHGGISPCLTSLAEAQKVSRFSEPPKQGLLCDIIWADPCSKDEEAGRFDFKNNKNRGCSFVFGAKAAIPFLRKNQLIAIIRGHEAQLDGYKMYNWDQKDAFPSVITVFSAPNYCDVYNNKGAILKFKNNQLNIQQLNYNPHPFILPDFLNVFSWSLPFVSEKIGEILLHIIKKDPDVSRDNKSTNVLDKKVTESLKMKVEFLTMLMKMWRTLRKESELIIKLKGFCPGNKIPRGIIIQGPEALKTALERYEMAKRLDEMNEKMPDYYE